MCLVSRTDTFAKIFFIISFAGLFTYAFLAFYSIHSVFFTKSRTKQIQKEIQSIPDSDYVAPIKDSGDQTIKYVLLWRINKTDNPIGEGQEPFIKYNCLHQNCHFTTDKKFLSDYTHFHAIIFNASDLRRWDKTAMPLRRSWTQKYVFFSKDSSEFHPICNKHAESYFNWTWTYKLYSDIISPYFLVKDLNGNIVAPSNDVVWTKYIDEPVDFMSIKKTKKSKAMALVFHKKECRSTRGLMNNEILNLLTYYLKQENLDFDIFGCKYGTCDEKCLKNIDENYFFYWVNEGSASEDYVTDNVLTAIETNTVPVVSGFTDYSRFLPPGSYIHADTSAIEDLPPRLIYPMQNANVYMDYFLWKKSFTMHRAPHFQGLCQLCSHLNNPTLMERESSYKMFRRWWFPGPLEERCLKRQYTQVKFDSQWHKKAFKKMKKSSKKINDTLFVM